MEYTREILVLIQEVSRYSYHKTSIGAGILYREGFHILLTRRCTVPVGVQDLFSPLYSSTYFLSMYMVGRRLFWVTSSLLLMDLISYDVYAYYQCLLP